MPRRLNRKTYGWSLTYGVNQRVLSDKYKENYDKINWHRNDEEWEKLPTRQTVFGKAKVKKFG